MPSTSSSAAKKFGDRITDAVRLIRPLAEGGMGRVWIAEHSGLNTEVVVKLMSPEMAAMPSGVERFSREAAAAAAIKSPHVVQVFDYGVTVDASGESTPYIVMERLEGKDLWAYLDENGRMAPNDVVTVVVQIAKALAKAHKAGIVHRDIKPDNIFLCDTEGGEIFVKLLDFGTARREASGSQTTMPGLIMGTPHYMSPEQSVGSTDLDARSDIWSLGVVAYEALTGQKPFDGSSVTAIAIAIRGPLPKPTSVVPELPPAVDEWFARACAQAPADRFSSVREAATAFAVAMGGPPVDMPTESIFFPLPAPKGDTPLNPVTRSAPPLIASLPARGSERRYTNIAAGVVMAATALVMVAIVVGRGPVAAPAAVAVAASSPSPPPEPTIAEVEPPPPVVAPSNAEEKPDNRQPATGNRSTAKPKPVTLKAAPPRKAPASKAHARKDAGAPDDDLARLANVSAKHAEPAPTTEAAPPPALPAP